MFLLKISRFEQKLICRPLKKWNRVLKNRWSYLNFESMSKIPQERKLNNKKINFCIKNFKVEQKLIFRHFLKKQNRFSEI